MDEPLDLYREPYGKLLPLAGILLLLCGIGLLVWAVLQYVTAQTLEIPALITAVGAFAAAGICPPLKKLIHDVEEIKKRFR